MDQYDLDLDSLPGAIFRIRFDGFDFIQEC